MISIHLHGLFEHLAFALLVLLACGSPVLAYFTGRRDGREAAEDCYCDLLEYGAFDEDAS